MDSIVVPIKLRRSPVTYDISIGEGLLDSAGSWVGNSLAQRPHKILVISNPKVFGLYGEGILRTLDESDFQASTILIGDGERFKSLRTLEQALRTLSDQKFNRTDAVIALGGGVVGDLAGFAASIYLRGIAFLQIPTTLLSMIDSSVGGKTGVNTAFGKNLVGSFYQPAGVLIDPRTLRTLPRRELTCGFCEAIKHGALSGEKLLNQTADFLATDPSKRLRETSDLSVLTSLLSAQVSFKKKIVQNDEFEDPGNTSSASRKILNFGHTFGHALEKVSNYRRIKHGEAVGHGIRFAAELSKKLELLGQDEVDLLNDVVRRAGVLPAISTIDPSKLLEAFSHDKKQVGNSLHWILLSGIGRPVIVPDSDIPRSLVKATLRAILRS